MRQSAAPAGRLARRTALLAGMGLAAHPARAQSRYGFDQAAGSIAFVARHLGLLTSTGRFERFEATLLIDPDRPLTSEVSVVVHTEAIAIAYPGAADLLRSEPFFDVARFPTARFRGAATGEGSFAGFPLRGAMTIRDVTQPFVMQARLIDRRPDPALGRDVASFSAEGALLRSAYGMVAEPFAISDRIALQVRVRLVV
jgi:polyisoprenoid-binding protein YceI